MPPPRRRPIPTPPAGGRPRVAGLNRRAAAPEAGEATEVVTPETAAAKRAEATEAVERAEAAGAGEVVEAPDAGQSAETVEPEESGLKAPEAVDWTPSAAPKPAKSEPAEAEPEGLPVEVAGTRSASGGWVLPVALVVVALLFAGLGTFFLVKSRSGGYDSALVDSATTSSVNGQVREAVEKSFSYNFADVTATEKAAKELLTGKALCQYNAVFGPVREIAPQQKLVVSVRVVSSAVSSLRDGRATVLVFADQVTTRTTDNQTGGGTAMLQVGAVEDGGRWKVDNLRMFGATADQDRQLQSC
ncbi:hypothetical protein AB0A63_25085 [Lentzea sp. NPDC042327]|uniref:hypothetical protein n=1 Tax=Lentzea sp. NPDC042327 TaxID=3154801 RepID=UPI0033F98EDF